MTLYKTTLLLQLVCALGLVGPVGAAQQQSNGSDPLPSARLVHDIRADGASNPQPLAAIGSILYFLADDGVHGSELWRTDGTDAGTYLVKDIKEGAAGQVAVQGVAFGNALLFAADDGSGTTGRELWISDGTQAGTTELVDINPGPAGSNPSAFVLSGNRVFFQATTAHEGAELWETDGTPSGTFLVKDIVEGTVSSSPASLRDIGGVLYFSAGSAAEGREPWKSDGTSGGTIEVADVMPGTGSSSPGEFTLLNGRVYFAATSTGIGTELWSTDGTPGGTTLVKDISSGAGSSSPATLTAVNDTLLFVATEPLSGRELWISDGTADGTRLLDDIFAGTSAGVRSTPIAVLGAVAVFYAQELTHGSEPWRTDASPEGTALVSDINPGAASSNGGPFTTAGPHAFFAATDGIAGSEPWVTDGTAAGTLLVSDVRPGASGSNPSALFAVGGTLYFSADDGVHGRELWALDFDNTPPAVTVTHVADGTNGWNRGFGLPVALTIEATDNYSGIAGQPVCTDNGTPLAVSGTTSPFAAAVTGEGVHAIACTAVDGVGNKGTGTDTVAIDWTPPSIVFSGNQGSYTVDQQVAIACTATDTLSQLASTTCEQVSGPAYEFALGQNTDSAAATDNAGNTSEATTTFTVEVTYASLAALVTRFTAGTDLGGSLNAKLAAAAAADARGNMGARSGILGAFAHQIDAQTGKALSAEDAAILLRLAAAL